MGIATSEQHEAEPGLEVYTATSLPGCIATREYYPAFRILISRAVECSYQGQQNSHIKVKDIQPLHQARANAAIITEPDRYATCLARIAENVYLHLKGITFKEIATTMSLRRLFVELLTTAFIEYASAHPKS